MPRDAIELHAVPLLMDPLRRSIAAEKASGRKIRIPVTAKSVVSPSRARKFRLKRMKATGLCARAFSRM
jgi:hypothetical protein